MPNNQKQPALFITDKVFIDYDIPGGVQICTAEFITYLQKADFDVQVFKVTPSATIINRIKAKLGLEAYELYNVDVCLEELINTINTKNIKFVFFNQLNLSYWTIKIKERVDADVKFIGLSHGNESGDYLHDITKTDNTSILQTWRLGKLIIKEKVMFSKLLDGVITISDNETYIDQWLGAQNILFLPRILQPQFISWQPEANTIGFVGTLNHLPNIAGIELLANQLQLNGFTGKFKVAGTPAHIGYDLEKKYPCITYCGVLNNDQLKQEISTWCIFLNPVFWYSRGSSTKLSQGINWGVPVLTTPAGMRGYELIDNRCITSDNTPVAFTQMAMQVLNDEQYLNKLKQTTENNATSFNTDDWANKLSFFLNAL
jgi:hypothetical protein